MTVREPPASPRRTAAVAGTGFTISYLLAVVLLVTTLGGAFAIALSRLSIEPTDEEIARLSTPTPVPVWLVIAAAGAVAATLTALVFAILRRSWWRILLALPMVLVVLLGGLLLASTVKAPPPAPNILPSGYHPCYSGSGDCD